MRYASEASRMLSIWGQHVGWIIRLMWVMEFLIGGTTSLVSSTALTTVCASLTTSSCRHCPTM